MATPRTRTRTKPRVLLKCPANARTGRHERIIEFSFTQQGDSLPGGLIAFTDRGEDLLPKLEVYRAEGVEIIAPKAHVWALYLDTKSWSESIALYPSRLEAYESLALIAEVDLSQAPEGPEEKRIEWIEGEIEGSFTRYFVTEVQTP